jgi:CSLREA domain-containing protein
VTVRKSYILCFFVAVLLSGAILTLAAGLAGAATEPSLVIDAPKRAAVGQPIEIKLSVEDAADLAGYETNLLFDTRVAEFAGLEHLGNGLRTPGRDVGQLGAVELLRGVSLGAYSCPVEDCLHPGEGAETDDGSSGNVELATVYIVPNRPGVLQVKLGSTRFVDAAGKPVDVAGGKRMLSFRVGRTTGNSSHLAPKATPRKPVQDSSRPRSFDLTGDGAVTYADAMEAALAWEVTRENSAPCADVAGPDRDVNRDGCIDVADVQMVVSNYSARAPDLSAEDTMRTAESTATLAAGDSTFTVNSEADGTDAQAGDGTCATGAGTCTLRAAIQEANLHSGADTIAFNIPGTGVQTIQLSSQLPTLSDETGPTTIDGYTQPGSTPNTDPVISNANIGVQVAGKGDGQFSGLFATSPGNVIRGLAFFKLRNALRLYGEGAHDNVIVGNFVGTDAAGNYAAASEINSGSGVFLLQGASNNRIGGASPEERNVISGNPLTGVRTQAGITDFNRIINNIIGLSPAGNKALQNRMHGVDINGGSSDNVIQDNVLSGNVGEGIELSHCCGTDRNELIGNFVGTSITGKTAPAYASNRRGINVDDHISDSIVADNVVGNNTTVGIRVAQESTGNRVYGNRVGISLDGTPIPNAGNGVQLGNVSTHNQIGPDNIIAYNDDGISISGDTDDFNNITRNSIFGNAGLGIDLKPFGPTPNDPEDTDSGPNENLNFPVVGKVRAQEVSGTACAGCTVEIFLADGDARAYGEGKTFVGSSTADNDGKFTAAVSGVEVGDYVTATATDAAGNTSEFSPNKVVSSDNTPPEAPTGFTATIASQDTADLDWTNNTESDLAGYSVYRSTTSGGPYTKITTKLLSSSAYTDTGLRADTTYYYVVTAIDDADNESTYSNEASTSTPTDATAPETILDSGPTGVVTSGSATFEFSSSEQDSTFECSLDGAAFSGCTSPQQYPTLADGDHTFEVRAIDPAGNADPTPASRTWTVDASAPTVQAPEQSFSVNSTLDATTVPVKLTWSATDGVTGVTEYKLQQSTNGGSSTTVPINTAGTTKTVSLSPGDSYRFRVQAKDGAGNWSEWAEGPEFVVNAHQEASSAINYVGTWTQQAMESAYGGGVSYAEVTGDEATFSFVGRTFAWVTTKSADRGKAEVWVDGVKLKTADLYSSTPQPRKVIATESWSTSDSHTIEVRVLGTKNASSNGTRVDVDAFIVLADTAAPWAR